MRPNTAKLPTQKQQSVLDRQHPPFVIDKERNFRDPELKQSHKGFGQEGLPPGLGVLGRSFEKHGIEARQDYIRRAANRIADSKKKSSSTREKHIAATAARKQLEATRNEATQRKEKKRNLSVRTLGCVRSAQRNFQNGGTESLQSAFLEQVKLSTIFEANVIFEYGDVADQHPDMEDAGHWKLAEKRALCKFLEQARDSLRGAVALASNLEEPLKTKVVGELEDGLGLVQTELKNLADEFAATPGVVRLRALGSVRHLEPATVPASTVTDLLPVATARID